MKKICLLLFAILCLVGATGCEGKEQNEKKSASTPSEIALQTLPPVTPDQGEEQEEVELTGPWYVCLEEYGSTLTVREGASAQTTAIGRLYHGDEVVIEEQQGEFSYITCGELEGFVKTSYLVKEEPQALQRLQTASPGDGTHILVFKEARELELWVDGECKGIYSIGLCSRTNGRGHKQMEGDGKTPEGEYYVCTRNDRSRFYLSLGLSYPNKEDALDGYAKGLISEEQRDEIIRQIDAGKRPPWDTPLGGEIMIHGRGGDRDWTAGCVAVDDDVMDILWEYGDLGTPVTIYR